MDKIALITGAAGGVGRALTERLQSRGWRLALVSRERGRVNELAEVPEALAVHADVSTADGAETAVGETVEHFGRAPDALVNCAGSTLLAPLHRTKLEQYRACLSANLDSAFFSLAAFVRACLESKQPGSAVLVSSVVARIGVSNHEAIAAAKAGVAGLTQAAAASYAGQGIRVNALHRAAILGRAGREADRRAISPGPLWLRRRWCRRDHLAALRRGRLDHRAGARGRRRVLDRSADGASLVPLPI
jgi:NAD(P)-dependent dehydrogenase (short-subunit alcohol dehydrogenase family)